MNMKLKNKNMKINVKMSKKSANGFRLEVVLFFLIDTSHE
jgi:hypothetical protein